MQWKSGLALATLAGGAAWLAHAQLAVVENRLWQHRNLGKAFYENPQTQKKAVDEFKMALDLAPNSVRERVNYGLALLRAGDTEHGVAELEKAQKQDPKLPHTWFNLGIAYSEQGDFDKAFVEFQEMVRLVPNEPKSHYQLGASYKLKGDLPNAILEFERARDLDRRLAAPHFQLYGLYRQDGRAEAAAQELAAFQQVKLDQANAPIPEDMKWCWYAEIYDPIDAPPSPPLAAPVYRDETLAQGFGDAPNGVVALVLDGGTRPSLIAWGGGHAALYLHGQTLAPDSGLQDLRDVVSIAPGDFDNDGLPDLCVITTQGATLYRNDHGHFRKRADLATGSFRKALWVDFDHDYDPDLLLLGNESKLLRNNGEAGFSDETKRFPFVAGHALDAVRFDLEPDTPGFDVIVSYADRPGVLYRDKLGGAYQAQPMADLPAGANALEALDVNRDGRTDLLFNGGRLLNRDGQLAESDGEGASPWTFADLEGKGHLDRARIADGALHIEHDITPEAAYGNWIEIALKGLKTGKLDLGAKIEVKAGASYQKVTYDGVPAVFRLGDRAKIDTVRITWPQNTVQNETELAINQVHLVEEALVQSGSCPMIFTWNGKRFDLLTDVLGVAPLGASSGDGRYFPVDHREYVTIPGEVLGQREGAYEIRFTEELHEVSYIDQIKLWALDHPANVEVVTNEKFKSPPFPAFRLFGASHKINPVSAHDSHGADVRAALLARDRVYPDSFRRDASGVAELHTLDLDFGNAAPSNRAVLMLAGWVDWADGSTFLAATQAHRDLVFPYLQVKDTAGRWKTVVEDMGMPSGKPKTMAVDLAGKFLSASREVRIVTNLCVYWDEIYLSEDSGAPPNRMTELPLATADLHFRGFSRVSVEPERKQPEMFDYQTVSFTSMWNPTPGNYTRYGPVESLLAAPDDRMVIMGSGDEIALRFSPAVLPPLPAGWKRDFLIKVEGWAKDADANTAFSQSVLPLPFHGMSSYPYPASEHYPSDPAHKAYIREYLTRPALRLNRPLAPTE